MNKDKQLIYVTLDLRRGLFVAEATGAIILCSYKSDLIGKLREKGITVWCFAEECPDEPLPQTSTGLIRHRATSKWLSSLNSEPSTLDPRPLTFLVFKPSNKVREVIESRGWSLISANPEICRKLEDKITFPDLAKKFEVTMPETETLLWNPEKLSDYHDRLGPKFVVQSRMGHAGSSTWIVENGKVIGPNEKGGIVPGTRVKLCRWVNGPTYTLNGVISPNGKLLVSPLWQQLMHVPQWNSFVMGTIGISPIKNQDVPDPQGLRELMTKLGKLLHSEHYQGFFGLDLMYDGRWYLIECNPRFTASISLQCWIDVLAKRPSLLATHANQNEPDRDRFDFLKEPENTYGHIILRNTLARPWKIPKTLKSGIYALGTDGNWKLRLRDYHPDQIQANELMFILAHEVGQAVEPGSDFATLIYKESALNEHGHVHDRFFDFYERVIMGYFVRAKDFWKDRYVSIEGHYPIFSKPSTNNSKMATEVLFGETIKLLAERDTYFLIERADGTRGWMINTPLMKPSSPDRFQLPDKQSKDPDAFFSHWTGKPYKMGGNSEKGIDCSAFVQRYFWETKGILLPKNSQDQKAFCTEVVSESELRDDDLIFLRHLKTGIQHVGMIRNKLVWHSSLENGVVGEPLEQVQESYELEEYRRYNNNNILQQSNC